MSAEILKAKKQLGETSMLLKQGKLLAAVANLHDEEAGQAVDVALALVVEDSDTLAAGDDGRSDALAVPGEVSPQVAICLAC